MFGLTLRGWLDYSRCFLQGHRTIAVRRGSRLEYRCSRCANPQGDTLPRLRYRIRQTRALKHRIETLRDRNEDDIPF